MQPYRASAVGPVALIQILRFVAIALLIPAVLFSIACGHSSSTPTKTVGPAPTFTSTAPQIAQEGVLYTYDISTTTTDGSTVTYTATTVPSGATISGSTLSWTPTHAESRTSNSFTITATTSANGTATQTFTVTPTGNIDGTAVDHAITGTGLVNYPQDLSSAKIEVLISDKKGGYLAMKGSGDSSGNFSVPNVPPGSFYLHIPRIDKGLTTDNYIWTSSSDVDAGQLVLGRPDAIIPNTPPTISTNVTLSVTPTSSDSSEWISPDSRSLGLPANPPSNPLVRTFNQSGGLIDSTKGDRGFLLHYTSSNSIKHIVESKTYDSLAETSGGTISLTGSMTANSGSTADPNIKITQFDAINAPLADSSGPIVKSFTLYDTGYPGTEGWMPSTSLTSVTGPAIALISANLGSVTADTDLGSIPYGVVTSNGVAYSQFQDLGSRSFSVGSSNFVFTNVGSTIISNTVPTSASPIVPLLGEPAAPSIDGKDFLSNQANVSLTPQISWRTPSVGAPTSYELTVLDLASLTTSTPKIHSFFTNANSVSIPAGILQANIQYVFVLQAIIFQSATFQTAPFRPGTSASWTSEVSGLITTSTGTGTIRGRAARTSVPAVVHISPAANGRLEISVQK